MAATPSTMLDLGTTLPPFRLRGINGKAVTSNDFPDARGLVVAFLCPHCPYVRHVRSEFARAATDFQGRGVAVIAINSNDASEFPGRQSGRHAQGSQ
jgi:peroxiredoxin